MRRGPKFTLGDRGVKARLEYCLNSVLNVKAVVAAFNQEKVLVGAFSVVTNLRMDLFEALVCTRKLVPVCRGLLAAGLGAVRIYREEGSLCP